MRRAEVCVGNPGRNMVLRRAKKSGEEEEHFYMEFTALLLYLGAMILRPAKGNAVCSWETVKQFESYKRQLSAMELYEPKLYTPMLSNYWRLQDVVFSLQNCSRSTLSCFAQEMNVLVEETQRKSDLPTRLSKLTRHLNDKMQACPQCEVYNEEEVEIFLNNLHHILQKMCALKTL